MQQPPGWYPDPQDPSRERFWDGTSWSAGSVPVRGTRPNRTVFIALAAIGAAALVLVLIVVAVTSSSSSPDSGVDDALTTTTRASGDFESVPGVLTIVGDVPVPDGPPGEVSVVVVGPPDPNGTVVVVRNATDEAVGGISLVGTVRAASGELIDVGEAYETTPSIIGPGEWGFAHVSFAATDVPADAVYDLEVRFGDPTLRGAPRTSLEVAEVAFAPGSDGGQLSGFVRNPFEWPATSVIVQGVCFEGGRPTGWGSTVLLEEDIEPGGEAPFSFVTGATTCDAIAIAADTRF